jgi:hypothetical protein
MALEFHSNDNAREARPSVWVFQGPYAILLVFGVLVFILSFRVLATWGVDLIPNVIASAFPLGLMTLGVAKKQIVQLGFWSSPNYPAELGDKV